MCLSRPGFEGSRNTHMAMSQGIWKGLKIAKDVRVIGRGQGIAKIRIWHDRYFYQLHIVRSTEVNIAIIF